MKILQVVGSLNRGGAETWLVQVLRHIDRTKYQMDFLVHSTEPGAYDEDVRALGARVIVCLAPENPLRYAYNFRRILRQYGPYDCVHSHVHHYSGFVLMLAAMMGVPMRIAHSHNDTRSVDCTASLARKKYLRAMLQLIQRYATKGMAVSERAATSLFLGSWKSDSRWEMCPLGIQLQPFEQKVNSKVMRSELGIRGDAFVIGHVGRFVEQKNHRFLVSIAECLCRMEPRAVFLLVGDGPLRPEIEGLVKSKGLWGRFRFAGVRSDVPSVMKGAMDCFLLPSLHEGLGLVAWEAQAAGLQCLVSTGVPPEADVVHALVHRLRLSESANKWASALRHLVQSESRSGGAMLADLTRCSIQASSAKLSLLYRDSKPCT
jgi:glycosyltransferase involved in cell wall biosynthesis